MTSPISDPELLHRLAAEWRLRLRRGEQPDVNEYIAKYPKLAEQIRALLLGLTVVDTPNELRPETVDATRLYVPSPHSAVMPIRLGDFRILREIGHGGMGIVYEAEQESLRRRVALKVLPAGSLLEQQLRQRFQREARAAARLHHTNIVPVFGVGEEGGQLYYVMQLINGLGLDRVLTEIRRQQWPGAPTIKTTLSQPLPDKGELSAADVARSFFVCDVHTKPACVFAQPATPESSPTATLSCPGRSYWKAVARLGAQVAEALDYAAGQGVLHRDIKPSNLLLDMQGNVWVTDFGLAKVTAGEEGLTLTGDVVGTLRYLAPERFAGLADIRGDIYSLGLTLYEMLVHRPAFTEIDRSKLIHQLTHEEPWPPRRWVPAIPRDLETVILKAIPRDPADRYQTAGALAADLRRFEEDHPVLARRVRAAERLWRWCKRNPSLASLATAVFVLLAAVAIVASVGYLWTKSALSQTEFHRLEAVRQREAAVAAERKAEEEAERSLHQWYAASVNLMQLAWDNSEMDRLHTLLAETEVYPHRGFEWYYWQRLCHLQLHTFIGHRAPLTSVAWSPDGKFLATGSADGTAKIWPASGGRELLTLRGHSSGVTSLSWSPDGRRLATASLDGTAKVWERADGRQRFSLNEHEGRVTSVSWSPDGKKLVTANSDGTAKVWDAATGHRLSTIKANTSGLTSVSWSPDGKRLATGSAHEDGITKLWDVDAGRTWKTLKGQGSVGSVSWSPDGKRLAAGYEDGTTQVWDLSGAQEPLMLRAHRSGVVAVSWSANSQQLATGSANGTAKVWSALSGRELFTLRAHSKGVACVSWSPDGKQLATASIDGTAKIWPASGGRELLTLRGHKGDALSVAWSPDGKRLATGGGRDDHTIKVWDADDGSKQLALNGHTAGVESLAWSPDGKRLATASEDGTVKVWNLDGDGEPITLEGHASIVHSVAWSPDGRRLVTGGDAGEALIWDPANGQRLFALQRQGSAVASAAWSPDGTRLATGNGDGTVKVWDAKDGRELLTIKGHPKAIWSVSWSPDGQKLATGSFDSTAKVWRVADGRDLATLKGHTAPVMSVSWSPDGRRLATGSDDGTAKVWELFGARELLTLKGHTAPIRCVSWSPDGKRLATASEDGTIKVWSAASADAVAEWARQDRILDAQLALNAFVGPKAQGFIQTWLILLPLPAGKDESGAPALDRQQHPDEALIQPRPGKRFRAGDRELVWQEHRSAEAVLDFNAMLGNVTTWSVVYAVCYLESKQARDGLWLQVGSDDQAKVYLNGREIYQHRMDRALVGLDTVGPFSLRQGTNVLVFKVVNEGSGWQGCVRLVDEAGQPVPDVRVKLTSEP
jgi:WD40 repeat protein/serine/threonine protein kinase